MAKVCGSGAKIATVSIYGLCVFFFILLNFNACNSAETENIRPLYFPEESIDDSHDNILGIYSIVNLRTKRQTIGSAPLSNTNAAADPLSQLFPLEPKNVSDANVKQVPPGTTASGTGTTVPIPLAVPSATTVQAVNATTAPTLLAEEQSLLGVNGTGQRKTVRSTETPGVVVSEPIQPTDLGSKLSSGELPESFLDDIDQTYEETNELLNKHNMTRNETDHHEYYNSTVLTDENIAERWWKSFKNISHNTVLSKSHRRAITIQLSFEFPFYGHLLRNVTVATGGFLYTGDYVHSWLAATQYIAPLMANFDTSLSNESYVRFTDNGTAFTVFWEKITLQDKLDVGAFTFSATLHKNGDIVFAYFAIPIQIEAIRNDKHPVKVGLSDAYIMDNLSLIARRKTIYEYHRVSFESQDIKNSTIIILTALPTCLSSTDCVACLTENPYFRCYWCPSLNKCSTGTDRKRQDWLRSGCDRTQITNTVQCPAIGEKGNNAAQSLQTLSTTTDSSIWSHGSNSGGSNQSTSSVNESSVLSQESQLELSGRDAGAEHRHSSVGLVLGFMLPICFILSTLFWILYAYRNPHTKSGQLLIQMRGIKYRPSQWSWRRGEARYTAATIHM